MHHCRGRADRREYLAVRPAYGFPLRDIYHKDAGAYHLPERSAGFVQRGGYFFEHTLGLRVFIVARYGITVLGRGASYFYYGAYPHGARVAHNSFPRCARRN